MILQTLPQYALSDGYPQSKLNLNGKEAIIRLRCAWPDRNNLMAGLLGKTYDVIEPDSQFKAFCTTLSCQPFGGQIVHGAAVTYPQAQITAVFQPWNLYVDSGQVLRQEEIFPTAEFITQDHRDFRWGSGDAISIDEAPGRLSTSFAYHLTIYQLPELPHDTFDCVGSVTQRTLHPYTPGLEWITFEPETLLYDTPIPSRSITAAGPAGFTLHKKFLYLAQGWNWFWRNKTQRWEQMYVGSTVFKPYRVLDWTL